MNPAARMPQYSWNQADLDAVTTALLSQTGPAPTSALQHLVVAKKDASFQAVGAFAEVYERYKCYACHRFNGYGGTLAPDLSYEGSRAQKKWIADFLKNPQTIRPDVDFAHAAIQHAGQGCGDCGGVLVDGGAETRCRSGERGRCGSSRRRWYPWASNLYEVKYQCQSCHTIGATGGYVGPNLNNAGNWLTPAWIEAWLRNPQALQAGHDRAAAQFHGGRDTGADGVPDDAARRNQAADWRRARRMLT